MEVSQDLVEMEMGGEEPAEVRSGGKGHMGQKGH